MAVRNEIVEVRTDSDTLYRAARRTHHFSLFTMSEALCSLGSHGLNSLG